MTLTDAQIKEIAGELECGLICFYHRPTGTIESRPNDEDLDFDPEPWQDLIDKIESDLDNYVRFDKMESYEAFQVMEDFAHALSDASFKGQLLDALSRPKPFQNFKYLIDQSAYRQDWFDFKSNAYREHVERQIPVSEE
jgi:hypothetical protein